MVAISSFLFGLCATLALASPINPDAETGVAAIEKRSSVTGTNGGYYYQFYDSGSGGKYSNGAGGKYTVSWSGSDDIVAGKGWSTGAARSITFSGSFSGPIYFSVYGWFTNPLVDDGSTYEVYEGTRSNAPSIQGTSTFKQYWSIRTSHRVSGTVTVGNHWNEWKKLGLPLGTPNYQIVATEAFSGSGTATITVG
ncbi:Endo-1,4-beta-xylanase B [Lachnellula suecica]|uniref:endo-1,4-beta-xylanase n=1 Tax=Lachnellula suecica TaxID=602035 RepID=A0A8T9C0Z2_9HELO|nr:Endo-1,4-beta-xylanase B [Lachnellula suecica]